MIIKKARAIDGLHYQDEEENECGRRSFGMRKNDSQGFILGGL